MRCLGPAPLSDPRSGRAERRGRRAATKGVDVLACSCAFDEPLCLPDQIILVQRREGTKRAQQNAFLLIHDLNGQPAWARAITAWSWSSVRSSKIPTPPSVRSSKISTPPEVPLGHNAGIVPLPFDYGHPLARPAGYDTALAPR